MTNDLRSMQDMFNGTPTVPFKEGGSYQTALEKLRIELTELNARIEDRDAALLNKTIELAECQKDRDYYKANDRCAMSYLAEVRSIVGGDDFPDMVKRVAEAKEAIRLLRESLRSCISLSRLGSELRDEALEKTEKWK